jgi:hypothetical protein
MDAQSQLSELGHEVLRVERGTLAHVDRLNTTPLTHAQFLLGGVSHHIDFRTLDRVAKDLDGAVKKHGPEHRLQVEQEAHSLRGLRERLEGALLAVEPYREARPR